MRKNRYAPFAIVGIGLLLFSLFAKKIPHEQTVRIVLGDAAPRVTEVHVRYAERAANAQKGGPGDGATAEWLRDATFQFARGSAPRIVSHLPSLADGDYLVEIDVQTAEKPATIDRRVTFSGGTTSLDVSQAIPK